MIFKNFLLRLFSAANLSHSIYNPDAPEMNLHILQNIFEEKHAETNFAFCLASKPLKVRSIKVEWPVVQLCHHNNKTKCWRYLSYLFFFSSKQAEVKKDWQVGEMLQMK